MNKKKALNFLETHDMDIQNGNACFFAPDLVFRAYTKSQKIHGIDFSPIFTYVKEKDYFQIIPYENIIKVSEKIYNDFLKNKRSWEDKLKEYKKIEKNIDHLWKEYRKKKNLTDKEILKLYDKFLEEAEKFWGYAVLGEDKGKFVEEKIISLLEKNHNLTKIETNEIVGILTHPEKLAIFSIERKDFFSICLYVLSNEKVKDAIFNNNISYLKKSKPFVEKFEQYMKDYFFKTTSFYDYQEITLDSFKNEIKKEIEENSEEKIKKEMNNIDEELIKIHKRKKEILSKIKLIPLEKESVDFALSIVTWNDDRKKGMMKQWYYLFFLIHEVSKKLKLNYDDLVSLSIEEFREVLVGKDKLLNKTNINQRKEIAAIYEKDNVKIFYGNDAKDILDAAKKISQGKKEIKGKVASKGSSKEEIIKGKVRIVVDPAKDKFEKNDILVTSMTRIEFAPLMKKAKAIITNEGGIACHAAIVSRELGVPCIIGTKIATDVLKNGDLVEVDADNGMVRILEKNA